MAAHFERVAVIPDSKWMDFFSQPTKVMGGLFAFFACSLVLDWLTLVELSAFGSLARPIFILGGLLTGFLFLASVIAFAIERVRAYLKRKDVNQRRQTKEFEQRAKKSEAEAKVLARLDHLSKEEIQVVADALKAGSQSFYTYAHHPPVGAMAAKMMLTTPGGAYNQDHYPFHFYDFVWKALLDRREEFLAKHEQNEQAEAAARRAARRI